MVGVASLVVNRPTPAGETPLQRTSEEQSSAKVVHLLLEIMSVSSNAFGQVKQCWCDGV